MSQKLLKKLLKKLERRRSNLPIGVFDSGIGGLTVVDAIIKELPNESIIYLGDTARIPYGTRSREVINKFALELTRFLLKQNVKCLVVACNTISANALIAIKKISPVPVIDVISPMISSVTGRAGLIATSSTISSKAYSKVAVISQACPLFVTMAEEGITSGPVIMKIARGYLSGFKKAKIDTLILGCTHFPFLQDVIAKTMGNKVKLFNPGVLSAEILHKILKEQELLSVTTKPNYNFFFTDVTENIHRIIKFFFGYLSEVNVIKIGL